MRGAEMDPFFIDENVLISYMIWIQKEIILPSHSRGFHIITHLIENKIEELQNIRMGVAHIFIKHTSASLTINEDADPTVRVDFESHMNVMVPEKAPYYLHTMEGPDDMPAHLKSSIIGSSVNIPITDGQFNLGTWQGIYLCEHRDQGGPRKIVITISGE
jgi:secondary thiamine-phosphate synthase enzyme